MKNTYIISLLAAMFVLACGSPDQASAEMNLSASQNIEEEMEAKTSASNSAVAPLFILCKDPNYVGCKDFNATEDNDMHAHAQFGDQASSARVIERGLVVEAYEHVNFKGERWFLRWDGGPNDDGYYPDLNDRGADDISSYKSYYVSVN